MSNGRKMDKFIEYLLNKNKMEICIGIIIIIFLPTYLINFIYYPDWFSSTEFIKITVLNAAILIFSYVIQMLIFLATHMIFTKKTRSAKEILYFPLCMLGLCVYIAIVARIETDNIYYVIIPLLFISFLLEVCLSIFYEYTR